MSLQHREKLISQIEEKQPAMGGLLSDRSGSLMRGSWDLKSWSFQLGFEAMWDLAKANHNGLLNGPMLSIWRQSIELTFKSCIRSIEEDPRKTVKLGHDLNKLFQRLLKLSRDAGLCHNDLDLKVEALINEVQSFDPYADRFRYPADRKDTLYEGVGVDLDKVFQAHFLIVGWCEGTVAELVAEFGIGPDPR